MVVHHYCCLSWIPPVVVAAAAAVAVAVHVVWMPSIEGGTDPSWTLGHPQGNSGNPPSLPHYHPPHLHPPDPADLDLDLADLGDPNVDLDLQTVLDSCQTWIDLEKILKSCNCPDILTSG